MQSPKEFSIEIETISDDGQVKGSCSTLHTMALLMMKMTCLAATECSLVSRRVQCVYMLRSVYTYYSICSIACERTILMIAMLVNIHSDTQTGVFKEVRGEYVPVTIWPNGKHSLHEFIQPRLMLSLRISVCACEPAGINTSHRSTAHHTHTIPLYMPWFSLSFVRFCGEAWRNSSSRTREI